MREVALEKVKPYTIYWTPTVGTIDQPMSFGYGYYTMSITKDAGIQININDNLADVVKFKELEPTNYIMIDSPSEDIPNIVYKNIITGLFEEINLLDYYL